MNLILFDATVDGSEIPRPTTWDGAKTLLSNGMNYLSLNRMCRISVINSMTLGSFFGFKIPRYHRVRIPDFMAECDLTEFNVGDMGKVHLKRWDDLLFILAEC